MIDHVATVKFILARIIMIKSCIPSFNIIHSFISFIHLSLRIISMYYLNYIRYLTRFNMKYLFMTCMSRWDHTIILSDHILFFHFLLFLCRPVVIPLIIASTLMSLSALSGYVSISQIYLNKFQMYEDYANDQMKKSHVEIDEQNVLNSDKSEDKYMDINSLLLGIGVATSAACGLLVGRVGVKSLLLLSASVMAASMFFLSLLFHFSKGR